MILARPPPPSTLPPSVPAYCRGWPSFFCSLAFLAALTALVVDVAQQIGCFTGVRDSVIANTVLALGTSIPGGVSIA